MVENSRRTFLKVLGGATAAAAATTAPFARALADAPDPHGRFIFIHAAGGWDVTMGLDPRNAELPGGTVDPATTATMDEAGLRLWRTGTNGSFQFVERGGRRFGPGIGAMADLADRLCVVNGVSMNTVSHIDGTVFSATGRHLAGGHVIAPSVDAVLASERGATDLMPLVAVRSPSYQVGSGLDARAAPLRVDSLAALATSLSRAAGYDVPDDRDDVTALLGEEARELAGRAYYRATYTAMAQQYAALTRMLGPTVQAAFDPAALARAYPGIFAARPTLVSTSGALNAAFAVESLRQGLSRCVSFSVGSFDTHSADYATHGARQQQLFDLLAALIAALDATPIAATPGERLAAHTHIMVFSDFCRTPRINVAGGRDHYPNNSVALVSPRLRAGTFGASDPGSLLPTNFAGLGRPISPPDILRTLLHIAGVAMPERFMRDGTVVTSLVRP